MWDSGPSGGPGRECDALCGDRQVDYTGFCVMREADTPGQALAHCLPAWPRGIVGVTDAPRMPALLSLIPRELEFFASPQHPLCVEDTVLILHMRDYRAT